MARGYHRQRAARLPIVGIDRSGIASTALVEGRAATVTGIVKRAYPTSTDQRLAIVPRTTSDITLGAAGAPLSAARVGQSAPGLVDRGPHLQARTQAAARPPIPVQALMIRRRSPALVPRTPSSPRCRSTSAAPSASAAASCLVGEGSSPSRTGPGRSPSALPVTPPHSADELRPTDLVNVTGIVGRTAAGGIEITVDDARNVAR